MADATRMMQRLDQRGQFTLKMEMEPRVARTYKEGVSTVTEYTQVSYPVWSAYLVNDHPRGWVWDLFGFGTESAKGDDLETVLADLLAKTEPRYVTLEDRVWEHVDYRNECTAAKPAAELAAWIGNLSVAA